MTEYHKIQTVFMRDPATNHKTLLLGQYSRPEFGYLADCDWDYTEKVDGTNIRIMFHGGTVTFGGKTDRASIPADLTNNMAASSYASPSRLASVFGDDATVCLYGEGYGTKIQKVGALYSPTQDFVLFDVRVGDLWLSRENVADVGEKIGADVVPSIGRGSLKEAVALVRDGFSSRWGDFAAEGIVARPVVELRRRTGERVITKIKHRDFA